MPRRKYNSDRPSRRLSVDLPQPLFDSIQEQLPKNPLTGKVKYGTIGTLVESLLRKWLAEREGRPDTQLGDLLEEQSQDQGHSQN